MAQSAIDLSFLPGEHAPQPDGDLANAYKILSLRVPRRPGMVPPAPPAGPSMGMLPSGQHPAAAVIQALLRAIQNGQMGQPGPMGPTGPGGGL